MITNTINNDYKNNKTIMRSLKKNLNKNINEDIRVDFYNLSTKTTDILEAKLIGLEKNYIALKDTNDNVVIHIPFVGQGGLITSILDKNDQILYYNPYCLEFFLIDNENINSNINKSLNIMYGAKKAKSLTKKHPRF